MDYSLTFDSFRSFLNTFLKRPNQYISYLKAVMEREGIHSLEELSSNIIFYNYKYKYCKIEGISEKTKQNYLTALNRFYDFIYPKEQILTFKMKVDRELSLEEYNNIHRKLDELNKKIFNRESKEYIEIRKIEKGSINIAIAVCSVFVFTCKIVKAIFFINNLIRRKGNVNKEDIPEGVFNCASAILEIAEIFLPGGASVAITFGKKVVEVTQEIIELVKKLRH